MKKIKKILGWFFWILFLMWWLGLMITDLFSALLLLIMWILLIPPFYVFIEKKFNIKLNSWLKAIIIVILFIIFWMVSEDSNYNNEESVIVDTTTKDKVIKNNSTLKNNNIKNKKSKIVEKNHTVVNGSIWKYKIINNKDYSHKALYNKSFSQHTLKELNDLPIDKKIWYNIVLDPLIKNQEVKPTIQKIILDISKKDNDIDEIILWIYSDTELVDWPYDIWSATWAPNWKLGNVTPEIAKNNIRDSYTISYNFNIKNIEEYFAQRNKQETKFWLTEQKRREYFKEIVKAEDRWTKEQPLGSGDLKSMEKNMELQEKLIGKYKQEVRKRYKINEVQASEIFGEAFTENWPLD